MSPELKFHSFIVSATTFIIFTVWTYFTKFIEIYPAASVVTACLVSLGAYRLLTICMLVTFRKFEFAKKFMLGESYMEGTWVGYFIGHDNTPRFYVETIEQDISYLVIRGKAFREDGSYHGTWVSDNAEINTKTGKITYTYEADIIGNSHINPGLATFIFERKSKNDPPHRMIGFSSDLFNPSKLKSLEEKVSNSTSMDIDKAFQKAKEIYSKNKDNF